MCNARETVYHVQEKTKPRTPTESRRDFRRAHRLLRVCMGRNTAVLPQVQGFRSRPSFVAFQPLARPPIVGRDHTAAGHVRQATPKLHLPLHPRAIVCGGRTDEPLRHAEPLPRGRGLAAERVPFLFGAFFSLLPPGQTIPAAAMHNTEVDYAYSAKAVKELRAVTDLILTMVLGLGVITFDLLDSGLHAHSICRYTLGLTSTCTPPAASTELERHLLPLIHMDTCNCLVRRQVPSYRLRSRKPEGVDHYIGLCVSLLPLIYDVCCVAAASTPDDGCKEHFAGVEFAVPNWSPSMSEAEAAKLTTGEVQAITTQATVYQTAILLFLHRLRFVFSVEDEVAA